MILERERLRTALDALAEAMYKSEALREEADTCC